MKRLRLVPILLVPAVALGLAACSGSGSSSSTPTPTASATTAAITSCPGPGASSKAITTSGDFGGTTAPKVTFKKGLTAATPQASTVIKGKGKKLKSGELADVSYTVYQAKTAKLLGSVGFDQGSAQALSVGGEGFPVLLSCTSVGSRIAVVGASKALGFGTTGQIVVVADVIGTTSTKSTGALQTQDPSLPTVKDKTDGEPVVTIPSGYAAPSTTQTEVIKQGTGDTLAATDTATVQYKGEILKTGKVFDSTWSRNAQPTPLSLSEVVTGFQKGLVGQKVGSQVLIIIPAAEGYGANPQEGSGIPKNADLLFVVDILAKS